jgi:phosphoribosyl-ATP pyrophosphohydrolase/phosphoribosyl-AMP cyclohydrolase
MTLGKIDFNSNAVDWAKMDGLIPAVVQDAACLRVLMLGYMNQTALQQTIDTGLVTFYSRSKQRLWQKGEESGHVLALRSLHLDCDGDGLLILADPKGPTCHLGTRTCWGDGVGDPSVAVLAELQALVHQRRLSPELNSYTTRLFADGLTRIAQKVGEEGVETALAAATHADNLADETADLLYHLLVLLEASPTDLQQVLTILHQRMQAN